MATDLTQPVAAIMAELIGNASDLVSRAAAADALNTQLATDKAGAIAQVAGLTTANGQLATDKATALAQVATIAAASAQLVSDKAALQATVSSQALMITAKDAIIADQDAQITALEAQVGPVLPAALKPLGAVGMNIAPNDYYGTNHPFLDRAKTHAGWLSDGGSYPAAPVNADLYPSGTGDAVILVAVDGPNTNYGQHYALESNKLDLDLDCALGGDVIEDQGVVNGLRRVIVDASNAVLDGGYRCTLRVKNSKSPFALGQYVTFVRLDQEAAYKAGAIFNQAFIDQMSQFSPLRSLDLFRINGSTLAHWADRAQVSWSTWSIWPMEIFIALCNAANSDAHWNLPLLADDDFIIRTGRLVEATLKKSLRVDYEEGNEDWNYNFTAYGQSRVLYSPAKEAGGDPAWSNVGYKSARTMSLLKKAHGYSARVRCLMMFQTGYDAEQNLVAAGAEDAITAWSTPSNPDYDVERAAHFPDASSLYDYIGGGGYFGGVGGQPGLTGPDKQIVQGWADATDDSGLAAAFHHLEFGGALADIGGTLNSFPALYANMQTIAARWQCGLLSYEFGLDLAATTNWKNGYAAYAGDPNATPPGAGAYPGTQTDPYQAKITEFFGRMRLDPRMGAFYVKCMTLMRTTCGFSVVNKYYDIGGYGPGGGYGSLPTVYSPDTPVWAALKAFSAAPSALQPLQVTINVAGAEHVGAKPVTTITTTGGVGKAKVTAAGLAAGQSFDGSRTITGAYTTQQDVTVVVTGTDEAGVTVTASLAEHIGPAQTGYRYFEFTPGTLAFGGGPNDDANDDHYYSPTTTGLTPKNGADAISLAGWTATSTFGNLAVCPMLVDGDPSTSFSPPQGSRQGSFTLDSGDGNLVKPTSFDIGDGAGNYNFTIATMTLVRASIDGTTWLQVAANSTLIYANGVAPLALSYPS